MGRPPPPRCPRRASGRAIIEEGSSLLESFPELKFVSKERLPSYSNAPRPLELGKFILLREQWAIGVVRDMTHCVTDPSGEPMERHIFRNWLSGLRPGVKQFLLCKNLAGRFERITLEREEWQRTCDKVKKFLVEEESDYSGDVTYPSPAEGMARH